MTEPLATFKLDGQEVPFAPGQTVLQAALAAGCHIPHLCYHPEFRPHGSCKLCTVKVNGAHATSCTLPARTGLEVESWMDSNAQLLSALQAQSISTGLIRVFTSIVVMLGIASVLVVSVVQKSKEIGILRAMGATRWQMTQVFLLQGAIVGWIGSLLGVGLAQAMLWGFSNFAKGSDGKPLFVVGLPPDLALTVALVATAAGVLAAVAPARRAARLDPAQAIRL
jgi:lipoprotein-releasing system permease protein